MTASIIIYYMYLYMSVHDFTNVMIHECVNEATVQCNIHRYIYTLCMCTL